MRKSLRDYCEEYGDDTLLRQWDRERNGALSPEDVSYGSKLKVWWRCGAGHEWKTSVQVRTRGSGCPYCAGRKPAGDNTLAALYPDIAAQWHPEKNRGLTPADVTCGSKTSVWWVCGRGHEYRSMVKTRTEGAGCPVCAGKQALPGENDLESCFPEIAAQWHPSKNGDLKPSELTPCSHRKVWWVCSKGHEYQARVESRTLGSGCPYCAGKAVSPGENDLASCLPEIAAQWDFAKNGVLRPENVTPCSNRQVWWICDRGHEYKASIGSRTARGTGCPYCAGRLTLPGFNDLATVEPRVAAQWHPTMNGKLSPEMVTRGSKRRVWWQCPLGHVWKAAVFSRTGTMGCGCPVCAGKVRERRTEYPDSVRVSQQYIPKANNY